MFDNDLFKMAFIFALPIIAVVGGITMGIIRTLGEQRLAELARRERIAAIERGIDPDKLPPVLAPDGYSADSYGGGGGRLRRAHGLMIAGSILIAVGIATFILLASVEPDKSHKLLGLLPLLTGCALIFSSRVIWPKSSPRS
jgi:hypothetical protein